MYKNDNNKSLTPNYANSTNLKYLITTIPLGHHVIKYILNYFIIFWDLFCEQTLGHLAWYVQNLDIYT